LIDAQVVGDNLEITLSGGDAWLFTLRPRWSVSVPLGGVLQASAGAAIGRGTRRHVNERRNERLKVNGRLICAHAGATTLRIELCEGPYRRMVLSVPDPAGTARVIQDAIAARPR
jgi:hypothetical protein